MDLKDLKEILQILDERAINEFELEEEGFKLRVRKVAPEPIHQTVAAVNVPRVVQIEAPSVPGGVSEAKAAASAPDAAVEEAQDENVKIVTSPMVGTFYRAPDPNAPPFVNTRDRVRAGQVVCIIEAMKLMNEIESDVAGEIVKIHQENGQPVQFGAPLFSVRIDR